MKRSSPQKSLNFLSSGVKEMYGINNITFLFWGERCFTCSISFDSYKNPFEWVCPFLFYRWGNWTSKSSYLPKFAQLASRESMTPNPKHFSLCCLKQFTDPLGWRSKHKEIPRNCKGVGRWFKKSSCRKFEVDFGEYIKFGPEQESRNIFQAWETE